MSIPTNTLLDGCKPLHRPGRTAPTQNPRPRRNRVRTRWIDRAFIWVLFGAMLFTAGKNARGQNVPEPTHYRANVIIYGGTSAAVTAAVQAARMGESVIMVSPDVPLGGLSSADSNP